MFLNTIEIFEVGLQKIASKERMIIPAPLSQGLIVITLSLLQFVKDLSNFKKCWVFIITDQCDNFKLLSAKILELCFLSGNFDG